MAMAVAVAVTVAMAVAVTVAGPSPSCAVSPLPPLSHLLRMYNTILTLRPLTAYSPLYSNSSSKRRIELDVMKLLTSDFHAALVNDNLKEFKVCLEGPADSLYEGGVWKVRVELPDQYPYKSPSIGFETRIFHPNIDEQSGSVCLDVINQTWSPMFTISHIFETFLPQLLNDPNAADPLNGEASTLYLNDRDEYDRRVRSYVDRFANRATVLANFKKEMGIEDEDDEEDANADAGVEQRVTEDRAASRNTQGTLSEYEIDGDLSSIDDDDEEEVDVHADYGVDGQGATAGTRKTQHLHADTSAHTVHAVAAPGAGDNNTKDSDSDNDSLDLDL